MEARGEAARLRRLQAAGATAEEVAADFTGRLRSGVIDREAAALVPDLLDALPPATPSDPPDGRPASALDRVRSLSAQLREDTSPASLRTATPDALRDFARDRRAPAPSSSPVQTPRSTPLARDLTPTPQEEALAAQRAATRPEEPDTWERSVDRAGGRLGRRIEQGARQAMAGREASRLAQAEDELTALYALRDGGTAPQGFYQRRPLDLIPYERDAEARDRRITDLEGWIGERSAAFADQQEALGRLPNLPTTQRMMEAQTFGDAWGAFMEDPIGVINDVAIPSLVQLAPALSLAAATGNPVAGAAALGSGSANMEYGAGIGDALIREGVDITDPDAVRAAVANPGLMARARERAETSALMVGGMDAASFGLASRALLPARAMERTAGRLGNVALQANVQGAMGATGEGLKQLANDGALQPGELLGEYLGEFSQAPVEVLAATRGAGRGQAGAPLDQRAFRRWVAADPQRAAAYQQGMREDVEALEAAFVQEQAQDAARGRADRAIGRLPQADPHPVPLSQPVQRPERGGVSQFETAQGSTYAVLPDGRVRRTKRRGDLVEEQDPLDLTVFADPADEDTYRLLQDAVYAGGGRADVVDGSGRVLRSHQEAEGADRLFVAVQREGRPTRLVPATLEPQESLVPFEYGRIEENGQAFSSRHVGNRITRAERPAAPTVGDVVRTPEPLETPQAPAAPTTPAHRATTQQPPVQQATAPQVPQAQRVTGEADLEAQAEALLQQAGIELPPAVQSNSAPQPAAPEAVGPAAALEPSPTSPLPQQSASTPERTPQQQGERATKPDPERPWLGVRDEEAEVDIADAEDLRQGGELSDEEYRLIVDALERQAYERVQQADADALLRESGLPVPERGGQTGEPPPSTRPADRSSDTSTPPLESVALSVPIPARDADPYRVERGEDGTIRVYRDDVTHVDVVRDGKPPLKRQARRTSPEQPPVEITDRRSPHYEPAVVRYLVRNAEEVEATSETVPPPQDEAEALEHYERVAAESTNPYQLIEAYSFARAEEEATAVQPGEGDPVAEFFQTGAIRYQDFVDVVGVRPSEMGVSPSYFSREARSLDQIAQQVASDQFGWENVQAGREQVTEQDIIDFVLANPRGPNVKPEPVSARLAQRFEEVVSVRLTETLATRMIEELTADLARLTGVNPAAITQAAERAVPEDGEADWEALYRRDFREDQSKPYLTETLGFTEEQYAAAKEYALERAGGQAFRRLSADRQAARDARSRAAVRGPQGSPEGRPGRPPDTGNADAAPVPPRAAPRGEVEPEGGRVGAPPDSTESVPQTARNRNSRFSRTTDGGNPTPFTDEAIGAQAVPVVEAVVLEMEAAGLPAPVVVATPNDLPPDVQLDFFLAKREGQLVLGLYRYGEAYLIASEMARSPEAMRDGLEAVARRTHLHEVVGHVGLRGLLGDDFGPTMLRVFSAVGMERMRAPGPNGDPSVYESNRDDLSGSPALTDADKILLAEEYLATRAGSLRLEQPSLWERIKAILQRALGRLRGTSRVESITDADLDALLRASADFLRAQRAGASTSTRFRRVPAEGAVPPEVRAAMAAVEEVRDDQGRLLAPNGRPSNLNETQWRLVRTPAFLEFFGPWLTDPESASKVVDENGEPEVLMHGTGADFTAFEQREDGGQIAGPGIYASTEPLVADTFAEGQGGSVMPVFYNLRNPLDLDAPMDEETALAIARRVEPFSSYEEGRRLVFSDEVQAAFARGEGWRGWAFFEAAFEDATVKAQVTRAARALGHDGIRHRAYDDYGGPDRGMGQEGFPESTSFVAFEPEQVKSATGNRGTFDPGNRDVRYHRTADPSLFHTEADRAFGQVLARARERVEAVEPAAEQVRALLARSTSDPAVQARWNWAITEALRLQIPDDADGLSRAVLTPPKGEKPHVPTDAEHAALVIEAVRLTGRERLAAVEAERLLDAGRVMEAAVVRRRMRAHAETLERITEAADRSSREANRALSLRRFRVDSEAFRLQDVLRHAKVQKLGPLTPEERAAIEESVRGLIEADAALAAAEREEETATTDAARKAARRKVEQAVAFGLKRATAEGHRDRLLAERGEILSALGGAEVRGDDGNLTTEARALVSRLALNHAKAAALTTEEVVARVQRDLQAYDVSADEVLRALSSPKRPQESEQELARRRVEQSRARKAVRAAVEALKPPERWGWFAEIVGTPRALMATGDMSAVLRQGALLIPANMVRIQKGTDGRRRLTSPASVAFGKAFGAFFSHQRAEQIDLDIRQDPRHFVREAAGLFVAPFGEGASIVRLTEREEAFMSRYLERLPGLGAVLRASERHYVSFLNLLRVAAFDAFADGHPQATMEQLRAWADFVNAASGRGNLGRFEQAAGNLSAVFFAPRFAVSRWTAPVKLVQYAGVPQVRAEIARTLGAFVVAGLTALALADWAGGDEIEVGMDPRDSDFGRIVLGPLRIDVWGGFLQTARLVCRVVIAGTDAYGLTERPKHRREEDPFDAIATYARYKLAPAVSIPIELVTRKNAIGQDVTPMETLVRSVIPLSASQTWESYQSGRTPEESARLAAAVFAGSWWGIGIDAYDDPLDHGPVKALLERAEYGPRPGNADAERFGQNLARLIEAYREPLSQVRGQEELREVLEGLAARARKETPVTTAAAE